MFTHYGMRNVIILFSALTPELPINLCPDSDESGECFPREISAIEKRYPGIRASTC
jgi:hypothetical protein